MTNNRHGELFELPADAGGEPFQRSGLGRHTNFQARASRAGADFKAMAISRLREAGATIERIDFEIDKVPGRCRRAWEQRSPIPRPRSRNT